MTPWDLSLIGMLWIEAMGSTCKNDKTYPHVEEFSPTTQHVDIDKPVSVVPSTNVMNT